MENLAAYMINKEIHLFRKKFIESETYTKLNEYLVFKDKTQSVYSDSKLNYFLFQLEN